MFPLCLDSSDYICSDGSAIPSYWECDDIVDCAWGEDEMDCSGKLQNYIFKFSTK